MKNTNNRETRINKIISNSYEFRNKYPGTLTDKEIEKGWKQYKKNDGGV